MIESLWKVRFFAYVKEISKYFKYMFNGHLVLALLFILAGAAVYYDELLQNVTSDFPIGFLLGVIFGIVLMISPTVTFLKDPDKVFLIAAEEKLSSYFKKSFIVSFVVNAYVIFMVFIVSVPLINQVAGDSVNTTAILAILIIVKFLNQFIQFGNKFDEITSGKLIRFGLNFLVIYFIFESADKVIGFFALVILIGLAANSYLKITNNAVPWIRLIEDDTHAMNKFYTFANMFMDVPHLRNKVRERKWTRAFLPKEKFRADGAYRYLIARTFFRANDYFGLYLRLTIIGGVLIAFGDLGNWSVAVAAAFVYMSTFQLMPILAHHEWHIMARIMPIEKRVKIKSAEKFLWRVIIVQIFILAVISFVALQSVFIFIAIIVVSLFIAFVVVKHSTRKLLKFSR